MNRKNETTKMSRIKFSVICVAYNHALYIQQCIESVLNQSYPHWELLILDDGSPDGTRDKVEPYLQDARIHYFYQENKGAARLSENYNFLLHQAEGTYVTILEADDYADSELLAEHQKAFMQNPQAILSFSRVRADEIQRTWAGPELPQNEETIKIYTNTPVGTALNLLLFRCFIPAQGTTVNRLSLLENSGFEKVEGLPTVDHPTWLKLAQKGTFIFIPKVLATWRRHNEQTTKQRIVDMTRLSLPVFTKVYDDLSPEMRRMLSTDKKKIKKYWEIQLTKDFIRGGNYQLQSGEWNKARHYYFQSFTRWTSFLFLWRLMAVLGIFFSWLHIPWVHWYTLKSRIFN
jgi:glycosyltransferase involved in cell wall biosynthesis